MDLSKPFEVNDFAGSGSLLGVNEFLYCDPVDIGEAAVTYTPRDETFQCELIVTPQGALNLLVGILNKLRELYLETGNPAYKEQIYVLLPRSYKGKEELKKAASEMTKKVLEIEETLSAYPQLQELIK